MCKSHQYLNIIKHYYMNPKYRQFNYHNSLNDNKMDNLNIIHLMLYNYFKSIKGVDNKFDFKQKMINMEDRVNTFQFHLIYMNSSNIFLEYKYYFTNKSNLDKKFKNRIPYHLIFNINYNYLKYIFTDFNLFCSIIDIIAKFQITKLKLDFLVDYIIQ